jgi:urease accessory protein
MYFLRSGTSLLLAKEGSQLVLDFRRDGAGRTFIARQYADYPFHICKAQYLDEQPSGMATLYIQSCSGGLFEHDRLSFSINAAEGTAVHLTTQASTIVHSARGSGFANQYGTIVALPGALIEYLPDPIILFPGSRFTTRLTVQLAETASLVIGESFFRHDPAGGSAAPDVLDACLEVRLPEGTLLARDRMRIGGETWQAHVPGCWGDWSCHGLLLVMTGAVSCERLCTAMRTAASSVGGVYAGATALPHGKGIFARFLARDAVQLKHAMTTGWIAARTMLSGAAPLPRRK